MPNGDLKARLEQQARSASYSGETARMALAEQPIAKGRIVKPKSMNKLEAAYDGHLFARRSVGEVLWYVYEGITLKLADDTRFTPDFFLLLKSGELEAHETKGFMRDDANVKLKIAARLFPFRFYLVTKDGDGWKTVEVKA